MHPNRKTARIAGWLYLAMALFSIVSLVYVPSQLVVAGDAAATAKRITESEFLLRLGIVSNFIGQVLFLYLVHALYKLLRPVDPDQARLMVLFVLASIPITFLNAFGHFAAIEILSGKGHMTAFSTEQVQALAMVFLEIQAKGIIIAEVFWGLWLFPFGWLVFKSGFIPKVLGVLLMAGGVGYLIECLVVFLFPEHPAIAYPGLAVSSIAEFAMIFWLIGKGVRKEQTPATALA